MVDKKEYRKKVFNNADETFKKEQFDNDVRIVKQQLLILDDLKKDLMKLISNYKEQEKVLNEYLSGKRDLADYTKDLILSTEGISFDELAKAMSNAIGKEMKIER